MYKRILELTKIIEKKSVFLFGPRQVGKTTLLHSTFPGFMAFNLLDPAVFRTLSVDPNNLRRQVLARPKSERGVIIDEVQRLPDLLNLVHLMIEEDGVRFILTGSSARALRRKGVNLLAGRARTLYLHPLTSSEIGTSFDLLRALNHGLLPFLYDSDTPDDDQKDYAGVYLREEIAAEGLTRNVSAFARFLEVAALCNTHILNYTKIASDAEIKRTTVMDYFQILYDTLLAFELPAWRESKKRKSIAAPKFYFFDPGVCRHLAGGLPVTVKAPQFGAAFEHFIFRELRSAIDYGYGSSLHYWRSTSGFEVDFILDGKFAIEVKAKNLVRADELKGLRALMEEKRGFVPMVVACVEKEQIEDGIAILPWKDFLRRLWARDLGA